MQSFLGHCTPTGVRVRDAQDFLSRARVDFPNKKLVYVKRFYLHPSHKKYGIPALVPQIHSREATA